MDKRSYRPKMDLYCGLNEYTRLPINQSIVHYVLRTDPTDLRICTRICGAVHTDLWGCLWIYTTELVYSLSGLKFKKTIHMK